MLLPCLQGAIPLQTGKKHGALLVGEVKEVHLIWLPRTLMLSKGCADWPLRMSFTFFRCVFMAMSTPAGHNALLHTLFYVVHRITPHSNIQA